MKRLVLAAALILAAFAVLPVAGLTLRPGLSHRLAHRIAATGPVSDMRDLVAGRPVRVSDTGTELDGTAGLSRTSGAQATPNAGMGSHGGHDMATTPSGTLMPRLAPQSGDCGLDAPAFCDTFDDMTAGAGYGSGRAGGLDERAWSVARLTQNQNPSQGEVNQFFATAAMHCHDPISGVLPPADYFECDGHHDESPHFMEALNDHGNYVYNAARIRQPYDFADRTGRLTWEVDAKTAGSHSWWTEVWVTDEPVPAPHGETPGTLARPRNGVGVVLDVDCNAPGRRGGVGTVHVVSNWVDRVLQGGSGLDTSGCYATADDMRNRFELQLSKQALTVWANDGPGEPMRQVAAVHGLALSFDRGYVSLEHAQYNAAKGGVTAQQTYHWDNVGFDGPVLSARGYDVPDALMPGQAAGSLNLGYVLGPEGIVACCATGPGRPTVAVDGLWVSDVDLTDATSAVLSVNMQGYANGAGLQYRLNGGDWHTGAVPPPFDAGSWRTVALPVALTELAPGQNRIDLATEGEMSVANVGLSLVLRDTAMPATEPAESTPREMPVAMPAHSHDAGTPAPAPVDRRTAP